MKTGKQIRAAVMKKPGEVRMEDFPWPRLEEGSMLIKIEMSGICGTDKHAYKGRFKSYAFPLVPGHENVGIVAEITKKASDKLEFSGKKLREGDRVVVGPDILCGRCYFCTHSFGFTWCENIRSYGASFSVRKSPYVGGGWAEHMYVFPGSFVYKVPEDLPLKAAVLAEPVAGSYSLDKMKEFTSFPAEGLVPGFSVLVQGIGPIGLIYLAKSRLLGAHEVIAIGKYQNQLEMAKKFGADCVFSVARTSQKERVSHVRDLTSGRGVDIAIDCTGVSEAMSEGLEMLRRGGLLLEVGAVADSATIPFSPRELCTKSLRIIGMNNTSYVGFIPAMELMKRHSAWFPFQEIVTHQFPLERAKDAIRKSMEPDSLKVVITP